MNEILKLMLIYGGLLTFGALVMNVATGGLPLKVLSVRASLGKKVLIYVHSITGVYHKVGTFSGTELIWRARGDKRSERRRIDIKDGSPIFRSFGVQSVSVEESTNAFLTARLDGVTGHDAIKVDNLIKRALMAPKIEDKKEIIIIILLIIILLGLLYTGYKAQAAVQLLQAMSSVTTGTIQGVSV